VVPADYEPTDDDRMMPIGENLRALDPDGFGLDEVEIRLISAYWALSPNLIHRISPPAPGCVTPDDRWVAVAYPGYDFLVQVSDQDGDLSLFDQDTWDRLIAHPWRLISFGPAGVEGEPPPYPGVVKFTDQVAMTSAWCDTRANLIIVTGPGINIMEHPVAEQTMVCEPPEGVNPPEPGADLPITTKLPIVGVPRIEGNQLIIAMDGVEYVYEAVDEAAYLAAFDRPSFTEVDPDPMDELERWEAEAVGSTGS
jgi:hypothetical protein